MGNGPCVDHLKWWCFHSYVFHSNIVRALLRCLALHIPWSAGTIWAIQLTPKLDDEFCTYGIAISELQTGRTEAWKMYIQPFPQWTACCTAKAYWPSTGEPRETPGRVQLASLAVALHGAMRQPSILSGHVHKCWCWIQAWSWEAADVPSGSSHS